MNRADKMIDAMCQFTKQLQKYEALVKFFVRYDEDFTTVLVTARRYDNSITRAYPHEVLTCMRVLNVYIEDEVRDMVQQLTGVSRDEVS
jgi:hypothetical protein